MNIEIIKNNNNVYLFHKNSSIKNRLLSLKQILSNIASNSLYSSIEKQWIVEQAISDYRSLLLISKN